jgi:hypothetical protein
MKRQRLLAAIVVMLALGGCAPPASGPGAAVQPSNSLDRGTDMRTGGGSGGAGGGGM